MLEILKELEKRKPYYKGGLFFKPQFCNIKEHGIKRKIENELFMLESMESMLPILLGKDYDSDPIKRAKNIASGKYDRRIGGYFLFEKYKTVMKLIIKLF